MGMFFVGVCVRVCVLWVCVCVKCVLILDLVRMYGFVFCCVCMCVFCVFVCVSVYVWKNVC